MTNKINSLFAQRGDKKLLSLYFCAGAPTLNGTGDVILTMQRRGINMIEVGIPFSDPMADGPVIQDAATTALRNGMSLKLLFSQLAAIKDQVQIPLILMGYLNPIMQYGIEQFCQSCVESGVSGMIIPDLPFKDYQEIVKPVADRYDLRVIMLITPETSEERIRFIDDNTVGSHHRCPEIFRRSETGLFPPYQRHELAQSSHDWIRHQQCPDAESCSGQCCRCHHRLQVRHAAQRRKRECRQGT